MLDPKTLKVGDVVVFGGKVQRTVASPKTALTVYTFFEGDSSCCCSYADRDPIWQIAELKKPQPPNRIFGFVLLGTGDYETVGFITTVSAKFLLQELKEGVAKLEAAGITCN